MVSLLPGEFRERRSLKGYSSWGCQELEKAERLTQQAQSQTLSDWRFRFQPASGPSGPGVGGTLAAAVLQGECAEAQAPRVAHRCGFSSRLGKMLWRREWQPTPVFFFFSGMYLVFVSEYGILWLTGFSSPTRDRTQASCIGVQSPSHLTPREVCTPIFLLFLLNCFSFVSAFS